MEYEFAINTFGEWEHWERICESSDIKAHVQQWRDELTVKLKCKALKNILEDSVSSSKSKMLSNKYLAELGWEQRAGRPTKEEKTRQAKIAAGVKDTLKEDMERLGLSVINGDK